MDSISILNGLALPSGMLPLSAESSLGAMWADADSSQSHRLDRLLELNTLLLAKVQSQLEQCQKKKARIEGWLQQLKTGSDELQQRQIRLKKSFPYFSGPQQHVRNNPAFMCAPGEPH
jgi:hypothetical protein